MPRTNPPTQPPPTTYYKFTTTPSKTYTGPYKHQSEPSHDPTTHLTAIFQYPTTRQEYYNLDLFADPSLIARGRNNVVYLAPCPAKLGCSTAEITKEFEMALPGRKVKVRKGWGWKMERYEECVGEAVDGRVRDGVIVDSGARSVEEGIGEMMVIPGVEVGDGVERLGMGIGDQEYNFEVLGKVVDGDVEFRKTVEELKGFFRLEGRRCLLKEVF